MFGMSTTELLIVGLVILLLFGGKKLPDLTRGLVDFIKEFRSSYKNEGGDK